jgi:hypothetical protein
MALASAREDGKGFVQKIFLLMGELAAEHQALRCPRWNTESNSRSSPTGEASPI